MPPSQGGRKKHPQGKALRVLCHINIVSEYPEPDFRASDGGVCKFIYESGGSAQAMRGAHR